MSGIKTQIGTTKVGHTIEVTDGAGPFGELQQMNDS